MKQVAPITEPFDIVNKDYYDNHHPPVSAGVITAPSYQDNGNGTVTIGQGTYSLYTNTSGTGVPVVVTIASATLSIVAGTTYTIAADYNSGSPQLIVTTPSAITETSIIPIYTVYRDGNTVYHISWDTLGKALPNKLNQSLVKTQRYRRESGLSLGESTGRVVSITSGTVWTGAVANSLATFSSNTTGHDMYLYYHSAGVWTRSARITQYNNTQYDDGQDLQTTLPNQYVVNYIYRSLDSIKNEVYIVLGTASYKLSEALESQPPASLPGIISNLSMLVGRIIVVAGAGTASYINSAFVQLFANSGLTYHNETSGLQGGSTNEYYHLTSAQYTIATTPASSTVPGYLSSTDWNTFNSKQTALGYTPANRAGDTFTGDITAPKFIKSGGTSSQFLKADGSVDSNSYLTGITSSMVTTVLGYTPANRAGDTFTGDVTATSFIKTGGTASQFLKADGSVDSSSYETTITAGTTSQYYCGDKTWQALDTAAVTESTNLYFTNARVLGTVLTGLDTTLTGAVVASDTILAAIGKLENRVAGFTASYVSSFNTRTGAVTLTSGDVTGALGFSPSPDTHTHPASSITNTPAGNIAATTVQAAIDELDSEKGGLAQGNTWVGSNTFTQSLAALQFVKSGGTASQFLKADGSVDSNSYLTGITSNMVTTALGYTPYDAANPNNYISLSAVTDAVVTGKQLTGYTPVSGAITSADTILSAFNKLGYDKHSPVTLGTSNGLSLSTQQLSLALASTSTTGALSSADWNTFNSKQAALGYTPANRAGDTFTGDVIVPNLTATSSITTPSIDSSTSSLAIGASVATINIGTGAATTTINLGGVGDTVNVAGTLAYINVTNVEVSDKTILINKGGAAASAGSAGITVEENAAITGNIQISADRSSWQFKAPANLGIVKITPSSGEYTASISANSLTADRVFLLPDATGTLALTSDVHPASSITNTPAGNIAATTVQAAIDELDSEKGGLAQDNTWAGSNTFTQALTALQFIKSGGTSSQFLKADGSVDSSSYESTITAGTTSQYYRGDKTWQTLNTAAVTESTNLYFTEARVRSTVLTGINTGSGGTVTETDTVLSAIGKLEYKSSVAGSGGLPSQTGNAGKVLTTDGSNASWSSTVSPLTITETSAIPYLSLTRSDLAHTITLTPTSANLLTSSAQIVLPSDPTTNLQAATKQYADNLLLSWPNASLASAITQWQSYTPAWTSLSNPQPSVGNGTFGGRWRRVGDSVECCIFMLTGTTTTFGTADWFFSLPAGLTIDTNKALSPLGHGMVWDNGSNSPLFGTVQVKDSQRVRVTNITNWNPTAVGWLSANDTIMIRFTVPIAEWSSNINLIKDFTEYAFNSSSTTSDDIVSFAYGKTGTNIVAYAGTGFDVLTKRVRFNTPILDSDIILIEFYNGTNWIPQHFAPFTDDSTGYGVIVIPLNTTDVNVSFRAKPNPVEAWSAYTSWKWRVRKISNGNFAQGSPSYTTTVGNGSATTITVTHNLGTSDVDVAIWELTGNRRKVDSGVEIRTNTTNPTTQVDLVFASAPAVNSLRVTVFSNGGTASLTSELQEFVSCDGTESGAGTSANTTYTLNNPVYGPNGSNFPAVAISSTTSTTVTNYDLPFINDIQPTDVLILEVNAGNRGWVPLVSGVGLLSPYTFANEVHTGVMLDRPAGSTNRVRVRFSNAGTRPGATYGTGADTWTTIRNDASGYRWRVRKISNGNFSQLAVDQYSYSEVATNKRWVNGKTIYRKVINFGTLPNANSKSVAHGVTGITAFVSVHAFSGGTPIPFVGGSPTDAMTLWVDFTHFTIWCAGNKSAATAIGIFEYTK